MRKTGREEGEGEREGAVRRETETETQIEDTHTHTHTQTKGEKGFSRTSPMLVAAVLRVTRLPEVQRDVKCQWQCPWPLVQCYIFGILW